MDKIRLEILGLSSSQSQSGSFALVLGEIKGSRRLPIIIGMFEAQAIAIEIEKITPNRPMTHDLFVKFAEAFEYAVQEVLIYDLKEGIFYAKLVCIGDNQIKEIDARPSDAIAVGLRFGAPIYTSEKILSEAGIILNESDEEQEAVEAEESSVEPSSAPARGGKQSRIEDIPSDQLKTMLEDAIKKEDYERAAKIRDELGKRN